MISISDVLKGRILNAMPGLIHRDGKTYAKYDTVRINLKSQRAEFLFAGECMGYIQAEGIDRGDMVDIKGLEGMFPLMVDTS